MRLEHVNIGYGEKCLLTDVSFEVAPTGVHGLLGPSGVGKSSLLRAIGRWNDSLPDYWAEGDIDLNGSNLLSQDISTEKVQRLVPMLAQKARLYTGSVLENIFPNTALQKNKWASESAELLLDRLGLLSEFGGRFDEPVMMLTLAQHKKILLARLMSTDPEYLLLDEPLRDVAMDAEKELEEFIQFLSVRTGVILVTHNKLEAKRLCDHVTLISGDHVIESTSGEQFFTAPKTDLGREFLLSGSCWPHDEVAPLLATGDEQQLPTERPGRKPREFHWIVPGLLAGMQKPGLLGDTEMELKRLSSLGIKYLITLTEEPFEYADLKQYGISALHYPVIDMSVPSMADAVTICEEVSSLIDQGIPSVLHCKAGLGRTGTMLASVLVFRGDTPVHAIDRIRIINPGYIQTDEQLCFVDAFSQHIKLRQDRGAIPQVRQEGLSKQSECV